MARRRRRKGNTVTIFYTSAIEDHLQKRDGKTVLVQVIVTSFIFPSGRFDLSRLQSLSSKVGKERLVIDVR
jgi:hypothetical protein